MSQQTFQQVDRAIDKIIAKFPVESETIAFTDIHLRVNQETGDVIAFDDDEKEETRCVVEEWINSPSERFYDDIAQILRQRLNLKREQILRMSVSKPFSWVLENEDGESEAELFLADDDDTVIIGGDLMGDLEEDLNKFLKDLMKEN